MSIVYSEQYTVVPHDFSQGLSVPFFPRVQSNIPQFQISAQQVVVNKASFPRAIPASACCWTQGLNEANRSFFNNAAPPRLGFRYVGSRVAQRPLINPYMH